MYGVFEQMLWRLPGDDPLKGVGAFGRVSFSPSDRNLVDFYADGGFISRAYCRSAAVIRSG